MNQILSVRQTAEMLYGEATRVRCNTIVRQIKDGTIKHAEQIGKKWYINATEEWPNLFPEIDPKEQKEAINGPRSVAVIGDKGITAETTLGELFTALASVCAVR